MASLSKIVSTLFVLITIFSLSSCRENEEKVKVSLTKRQDIAFRQQQPAITYVYLPLSVSFGIITEHGGKISVQSPPPVEYLPKDVVITEHMGPGAVFIVELPLAQGKDL